MITRMEKLILVVTIVLFPLLIGACNPDPSVDPGEELEMDLSGPENAGGDEDDWEDFPGLGFTWDEAMLGGGIVFLGTIATCTVPGPWDVWLVVSGALGPENPIQLNGEDTVAIPQISEDKVSGTFNLPMTGTVSDPDCVITYDLQMRMTVEISPLYLHVIEVVAQDQVISASCPGLGASYAPPELQLPTDFIVAPLGPFDCP